MRSNREIQLKINKIDLYKWTLIVFLIVITISIFLFITSLSRELIQSCLVQVSKTTDIHTGFNFYIHNFNPVLYLVMLLLVTLFWFNFFRALSVVYIKHLNTKKFVNKLKVKEGILNLSNNDGDGNIKFNLVTNKANLAFTYGYINPKVYISSNLKGELTKEEFNALIRHELSHKNSHDPLMLLTMLFIKELMPLSMLSNRIYKLLGLITELKADNYSILNSESSESLLNLYLNMDKFQDKSNLLVNNFARSRIDLFISNKLPNIFPLIFSFITILFILNFSTVSMAQADPLGKCGEQINQCLEIQSNNSELLRVNSHRADVNYELNLSTELTNCLNMLYTPVNY